MFCLVKKNSGQSLLEVMFVVFFLAAIISIIGSGSCSSSSSTDKKNLSKEEVPFEIKAINKTIVGDDGNAFKGGQELNEGRNTVVAAFSLHNVLHNIVKHGIKPHSQKEFDKSRKQEERLAKKCLKSLCKLYPDKVPEFCKELV